MCLGRPRLPRASAVHVFAFGGGVSGGVPRARRGVRKEKAHFDPHPIIFFSATPVEPTTDTLYARLGGKEPISAVTSLLFDK